MFLAKRFLVRVTIFLLALAFLVVIYSSNTATAETNLISIAAKKIVNDNKTIEDYCGYNENDEIFKRGEETVLHPKQSAAMDRWIILLPNVTLPRTEYEQIKFRPNDEVTVKACGCVQTGGKGAETWKRYVNPVDKANFFGPQISPRYYGSMRIPNAQSPKLRESPIPGFVRFIDLKNPIQITENSYLTLGYEDDDYDDNGYDKHDNGNENQCEFTGGAAVEIIIKHFIKKTQRTRVKSKP